MKTVVDLGCGDWQFSPYIYHDLGVQYVGYDVVLSVVSENRLQWASQGYTFEHLEFSSNVDHVQDAELYILKDVLQHWSSARIRTFLHELRASKPSLRFILICNCAEPKDWPEEDIVDGGWRPLTSKVAPLNEFNAEPLFRFPSLPNLKEVSVIYPTGCSRLPRQPDSQEKVMATCAAGAFRAATLSCHFTCRRAMHPVRRRSFQMV